MTSATSLPSFPPYRLLDACRGCAAVWVAMVHTALLIAARYPAVRAEPLFVFSLYGGLGVQMFFVISGYCIAHAAVTAMNRPRAAAGFMSARLRRIYPPCWCAMCVAFCLSVLARYLVSSRYLGASVTGDKRVLDQGPVWFMANLTLTAVPLRQRMLMPQCWTLCYEVAFYGLVGLALFATTRLRPRARCLLTGLHVLAIGSVGLLLAAPRLGLFPLDLFPQFGLGVMVYDVLRFRELRAPRVWITLCALLMVAFIIRFDGPEGYVGEPARLQFAACLVFAALLLALRRHDARLSAAKPVVAMAYVGTFSYSLYLTHWYTIGFVGQALSILRPSSSWHLFAFAFAVIGAVFVARVFYQFCERPFARSGHRTSAHVGSGAVHAVNLESSLTRAWRGGTP